MEMSESVAWLFRGHFYDTDPSDWTVHEHPNVPVIPLYTKPQKYCPSENNEAYEKGFIDGMAKQRDSAVQRFVEGGTPDSELAEHKRIIREQQAKIETLQEHNVNLVDDLFSERKEVIKLETEIEQLKALAISLSPNANLIYTKASEK